MNRDYYSKYFSFERNHWGFLGRRDIIRSQISRLIGESRNLRVLNIGVATGGSSEMLQEFGEVTSIEYDQECCDFVRERLGLDVEQGSILELKQESDSYDLVCAFDVIEHVEDDQLAVSEMLRVCKPSGLVVVTVPAFMSLWGTHDEVNKHYRRYRIEEVKRLFAGPAKIVFHSYFNSLLFPPIFFAKKLFSLFQSSSPSENPASDFSFWNPTLLNKLLYSIYAFEVRLLNLGLTFPFGVSVIVSARKETG